MFAVAMHDQGGYTAGGEGVEGPVVVELRDTAVSYDIAWQAASARKDCDFHTVLGSDHGFDSREREDEAITATVDWLAHTSGKRP